MQNQLRFKLNSKEVVIDNPDPLLTLNDYLRHDVKLTGTKRSCGEGGCGACTVLLTSYDHTTKAEVTNSVNSCLKPICAINGMSVTTVEAVGDQQKGFHPVQERIADFGGSQCGFCTPGMVMQMCDLLEKNPKPTSQQIEDNFDGNLCRCTGYRSIFDAFQTFSITCEKSDRDAGHCSNKLNDIEDLFPPKVGTYKHKELAAGACSHVKPLVAQLNGHSWNQPATLSELHEMLNSKNPEEVRLVAGNTSVGIFKEPEKPVLIDINGISDLKQINIGKESLTFGSGVTLTHFIDTLEKVVAENKQKYEVEPFGVILNHVKKVANHQVRNVGTLAGNLMLVHDRVFPSDLHTILVGANARITTSDGKETQTMDLMEFLKFDMKRKLVMKIDIPYGTPTRKFRTYKAMIRHENSHALVNAAFSIDVDSNDVVSDAIIAFGGILSKTVRLPNAEKTFNGRKLKDSQTFKDVLAVISTEVKPDDSHPKVEYRHNLMSAMFYKFYLGMLPEIPSHLVSASKEFERPVSTGRQDFDTDPKEYPMSLAIPKLEARIQASGEAKYVDDIKATPDTLYGALVTSKRAKATLRDIDPSEALKSPGVVAFYSAKDIDDPKRNVWGPSDPDEEFLATKKIEHYGQLLGIIVADSYAHALTGSKLVKVQYEDVQEPILTMEEAIEKENFFSATLINNPGKPIKQGDVEKGFAESDQIIEGTTATHPQYHFYMETHTCLVTPDEDQTYKVIASTQWLAGVQKFVAQLVGVQEKNVTVETRRCGGGYGGKANRMIPMAAVAALAASKLKRPVKMALDLNTNMEHAGKRIPFFAKYKVGLDKEGKMLAWKMDIYGDSGSNYDQIGIIVNGALKIIDNCYNCPNVEWTGHMIKTNNPPNTHMRGPSWVPAVFIAEHILEHVAVAVNKPSHVVKELNFYEKGQKTPYGQKLKYWNIPEIWSQLKKSCDFDRRFENVQEFNKKNLYTKRGINLTPMKFGVGYEKMLTQGALVNVYGDGTVSISHSGTEIGQGINTKVVQAASMTLKIPMSNIRVSDTTTLTVPNGGPTGGSVTSEFTVQATISACQEILKRVAPLRTWKDSIASKVEGAIDAVAHTDKSHHEDKFWKEVCQAATMAGVDLQAKGWFQPPEASLGPHRYNSYGVACTEVELDVLTGQHQILRVDIIEDCGVSMNPVVDIGQVQGAFVQGLGMHLTEELLVDHDKNPGELISNGTWEYKIPSSKDIPIDFRVTLLKNSDNPEGILRSKAVGEPPYTMSCGALFALKSAVLDARADRGVRGYFKLNSPATVDSLHLACLVDPNSFQIN
eukprot:TRINITY_DN1343_c0_g1_i2.p1 TRINITY_DN1343_c0_g1~~TRINITY_DN1343_c0_g1_i2.p1  ORF type:complete len:1305 (+),score=284.96 TRINITY_DN1343_c0_g1_i2:94-4008(+)